jgi:two-component system, oxyanion-binding sensor
MQAAWLYAQMLRWGQTRNSSESLAAAMRTFRADLYDAALGTSQPAMISRDAIGAFSGTRFDVEGIGDYLAAFSIGSKQ